MGCDSEPLGLKEPFGEQPDRWVFAEKVRAWVVDYWPCLEVVLAAAGAVEAVDLADAT